MKGNTENVCFVKHNEEMLAKLAHDSTKVAVLECFQKDMTLILAEIMTNLTILVLKPTGCCQHKW